MNLQLLIPILTFLGSHVSFTQFQVRVNFNSYAVDSFLYLALLFYYMKKSIMKGSGGKLVQEHDFFFFFKENFCCHLCSRIIFYQERKQEAGEKAQCLSILGAPPEDWDPIPCAHMWLTTIYNSGSRGSLASGLPEHQTSMCYTDIHTIKHLYTHKERKEEGRKEEREPQCWPLVCRQTH